jgi:hypothetical protein
MPASAITISATTHVFSLPHLFLETPQSTPDVVMSHGFAAVLGNAKRYEGTM